MNHVHLKHHVDIHEVGQSRGIGYDTSHLCCSEKYVFRALGGEKFIDGALISKIELSVSAGNDIFVTLPVELAHYRRANHPTVTGHVYSGDLFHNCCF